MSTTSSLSDLIKKLNESDPKKHSSILSKIKIPKSEFAPFEFWNKEGYSRNCIERTKYYELILICWSTNAQTPIHGHDDQDCWVYGVDGRVTEIIYKADEDDNLTKIKEHELCAEQITYMHDKMGYHLIKNESNQRAMTLHIYALPIEECEVFNRTKETFESKELEYDTYKGDEV